MAYPRMLKKYNRQIGNTDIKIDRKFTALKAGKRLSKNGKIYYETRRNRSDLYPKKLKI